MTEEETNELGERGTQGVFGRYEHFFGEIRELELAVAREVQHEVERYLSCMEHENKF